MHIQKMVKQSIRHCGGLIDLFSLFVFFGKATMFTTKIKICAVQCHLI